MKKVIISISLTILLSICSLVHAQTIIWVSEWKVDANGIPFDMGWVDLLRAQGYNVVADTTGTFETLNTAKILALDDADLVIISRNTNSVGYIDGGEITQWNSIDSPLILLNSYLTRTSRWQWISSSQVEEFLEEGMMGIVDEGHDIFKDISANNGQVDMIDESVNNGEVTFITSDTIGNGTILSRRAGNNYAWIAEWEAGTEFYSGTSQKPLEKRMLFTAAGSAGQESGALNLTETGKKIFLNSVSYMLGVANKAKIYYPANNTQDIEYDPLLSWIPGISAETHNVFFGTDFSDVQNATISEPLGATVSIGQAEDANTFDPGTLEFGKKYYWRVDEVDESAEVYKGKAWSFTVEKVALDLPFACIEKVAAISSLSNNDANNTVNGYGLGVDPNFPNRHSASIGSWVTTGTDTNNVWIQYDFDKQYKIHQMLVWNYNHSVLWRCGFKDVLVQYSIDGQTWMDVPDANYFNKAQNYSTYEYNTTVEFNDVIAKSVRITAFSNHKTSDTYKCYGLSEVRFTYIPVWARIPSPAEGAENVAFGTTFKWRKGREALSHNLYIGTDEDAVTNGTVTPVSLNANSYVPDLSLGNTYYWRVDEINTSMDPSVWQGNVWSFTVPSTILIEGFETGYGDDVKTNAVFLTWKDATELGNSGVNGSYMGRASEPFLQTINHSGGHSAPMQYNNTSKSYSEVIAQTSKLLNGSDWSIGSPKTLTIWFRGDPNVTDVGDSQLYCEIGGKKTAYTGSIKTLEKDIWCQWDINLTTLGASLSNIPTITIGVEKIGSKGSLGVIYLDDIMLTGATSLVAYPDVFIEAEAYDTIIAPMEVNNVYDGASGGEYINVKNGTEASQTEPPLDGQVTYKVNFTGGQYVIWGRVSIPVADQDAFWVSVDGAATDVSLHTSGWCRWNMIPAGEAWHWDDVHSTQDNNTNEKVTWTIPAGITTITIAYRDSDAANPPRLDTLLIQKVGE